MLSARLEEQRPLPTKKAAQRLGVHEKTLRTMGKRGLIDFFTTPGGHFRWNVAEYLSRRPSVATQARSDSGVGA